MTNLESNLRAIINEKNNKILPENIKSGVTIFGIEGEYKSLDTYDATATANDILAPKTAYISGKKVTGAIQTETVLADKDLKVTSMPVSKTLTDIRYDLGLALQVNTSNNTVVVHKINLLE